MEVVMLKGKLSQLEEMSQNEVAEFFTSYGNEFGKYMLENNIPVLHARHLGLENNLFVRRNLEAPPTVYINPKYILTKKTRYKTYQESVPYTIEGKAPQTYLTSRATKCLCIWDGVVNGKLKRMSKELKEAEAVMFQQMADLSKGNTLDSLFAEVKG